MKQLLSRYKLNLLLPAIVFVTLFLVSTPRVRAEEMVLSVSGNGENANSQVSVTINSNTTVSQSKQATVNNDVSNTSNTGGNNASSNTADQTSIQTGSTNTSTNVTNQNINTNTANTNSCGCNGEGTVRVVDNGANSTNSVNVNITNNTSVIQENSAAITNNANTIANTGKNEANNNNGNVEIQTGNITTISDILNKNINQSHANVQANQPSFSIKINGNGANSFNQVALFSENNVTLGVQNITEIINNAVQNLTTGENIANASLGNVKIKTGDIMSTIAVHNENINSSFVKVSCVCPITTPSDGGNPPIGDGGKPPVSAPPPSQAQAPGAGVSGAGAGGAGEELAAAVGKVLGAVLPVTGSYMLLLITLANLIAFFMGVYLRMQARSPNFAFA